MQDNLPINNSEIVDIVAKSGIFSAMLATVRALLIQNEPLAITFKRWIAGVLSGIIVAIICYIVKASIVTIAIWLIVVAPFITTIFPLIERGAVNFVNRFLRNNNDK